MKKIFTLLLFLSIGLGSTMAQEDFLPFHGCHQHKFEDHQYALTEAQKSRMLAGESRSDTIDILHYAIRLEVFNTSLSFIKSTCTTTLTPKMDGVEEVYFDLLDLDVTSVSGPNGALNYTNDGNFLTVDLGETYNVNDTLDLVIDYEGSPTVASSGFGGFIFASGYAFNLGIGLGATPYNYGRGWFPCFDNFVERSTFSFDVVSLGGNRAYCSGTFMGEQQIGGDTLMRSYDLTKPIPTYLAGVAVSTYSQVDGIHPGIAGDIRTQLIAKTSDTTDVKGSFFYLGECIDALEWWFGPYIWDRVGFIMTPVGAMEHVDNIAYPVSVGTGGATFGQNRLMAHELAHHWWGNMTTLSSPADMWFKEGNAEYAAHLFTEYTFGHEEFIKQVRDNFKDVVMTRAHIDDGSYLQLSGIPYEHTYGTHTYYKGASMIHNLRAYLGDDIFRDAMTNLLSTYLYQSIDGPQMRDYLSSYTGIDMNPFFDAWILNPGYSSFEIDSIQSVPMGGEFEVTVSLTQKLLGAPEYHESVPIEVTFTDHQGNEMTREVMVSGQNDQATVSLPFIPVEYWVNGNYKLNLAQFHQRESLTEEGNYNIPYVNFDVDVEALTDTGYVVIDHYWTAPDPFKNNPNNIQLSNTHYWRVGGYLPDDMDARAIVEFNIGELPGLDDDLLGNTLDSLILVYRRDDSEDWVEYPDYTVIELGGGFIRINQLRLGEYAFANGEFILVDTEEPQVDIGLNVFPNPVQDRLQFTLSQEMGARFQVRLFNTTGQQVKDVALNPQGLGAIYQLPVDDLPNGQYWLSIRSSDGVQVAQAAVQITR